MFEEKTFVTIIGILKVVGIEEDFIETDPFGKGTSGAITEYTENGFQELDADGLPKDFDGLQAGDFYRLNGKYDVVSSNEVFTKIKVGSFVVSIPNNKVTGGKDNDKIP